MVEIGHKNVRNTRNPVKGSRVDIIIAKAEDDKNSGIHDPSSIDHKTWNLIDCFGHYKLPDVPMHALGHGMIPDVMYLVQQVLSHHNKFTSFVRYANSLILEDILTFRLDYCKIKKLPKAAWVGENCMAFMRLMSYLYGSYLMNNPLSANEDETKETVTNLKCMINAFQALVSALMTKRAVTPASIKNHMKLFMSSAHYLHMKYGNMNRKSKQPDVTSESRPGNKRKKGNPKDYVSTLNMADLSTFLGEFNLHDDDAKKELRKRVRQILVATLKAKLLSWNLSTVGTKEDLQCKCE